MEIIAFIIAIVVAIIAWNKYRKRKLRQYLLDKYGDDQVVEAIMAQRVWQGMSEEQLVDSWGTPAAKDYKVYKTKTAETFKYNQTGKNRFRSRARVEDGVVVGWDQK